MPFVLGVCGTRVAPRSRRSVSNPITNTNTRTAIVSAIPHVSLTACKHDRCRVETGEGGVENVDAQPTAQHTYAHTNTHYCSPMKTLLNTEATAGRCTHTNTGTPHTHTHTNKRSRSHTLTLTHYQHKRTCSTSTHSRLLSELLLLLQTFVGRVFFAPLLLSFGATALQKSRAQSLQKSHAGRWPQN